MTTGARPNESSSIISSFGRAMTPRAIATICCSPPERWPCQGLQASLTRGKISITRCRSRLDLLPIVATERDQQQLIAHRPWPGTGAGPRHVGDAQLDDTLRWGAGDRVAGDSISAQARRQQAADGRQPASILPPRWPPQSDDLASEHVSSDTPHST